MHYPENALVLNGKVIALMEPESAVRLMKIAEEATSPGVQHCDLEIPLSRDSFSVETDRVGIDLVNETPVKRAEVKLTMLFVQKGKSELVRG